jgi:hypothetical protein
MTESRWTPPKQKRQWPWILLAIVIAAVVINVALTI